MSHYDLKTRKIRGFLNWKKKDKDVTLLHTKSLKNVDDESVLEKPIKTEEVEDVNIEEIKSTPKELEHHENEVEKQDVSSKSEPVLEELEKTEEFVLLQVEGVDIDQIEEQDIKETAKESEELEPISEEEFKSRQEEKLLIYKDRVSKFDGDKDLVFFQLEEDLRRDVLEVKKWKSVFPQLQKEYSDKFRELRNEMKFKTERNFANEEEKKEYVLRRLDKLDGELKKLEEGMKNQEPSSDNKIYWEKTLNMFIEEVDNMEIVEDTFERKREIISEIKSLFNQLSSLDD